MLALLLAVTVSAPAPRGPAPLGPAPSDLAPMDWSRDLVRFQVHTPAALACDPAVIEGFKSIWKQSGEGKTKFESGMRIDRDADGGLRVVIAKQTFEDHRMRIGIIPGVTVAIAHTHPNDSKPEPAPQDRKAPVSNFVLSRYELHVTAPETGGYYRVRRDWADPCRR